MVNWKERLRVGGIHFCISLGVACLAGALVFLVWYPYPYREISGGRELFLLVVAVDVVIGPLITFAIFSSRKSRRALALDFAVIGLLQLAALGYGLWTVAVARPVHLVFEFDRFRVVHAVDIDPERLQLAPEALRARPWSGPTLLGLRRFRSPDEQMKSTLAALQGASLSADPNLWQPYEASRGDVLKMARPVAQLKQQFKDRAGDIDAALKAAGRDAATTSYLPLLGRKSFWTAFVDPATAQVVGFMPLDPY